MTTGKIVQNAFEASFTEHGGNFPVRWQIAADAVTRHERERLCHALSQWWDDDSDERTSEQFLSDLRAGKHHTPPLKTLGQVAAEAYFVDWWCLNEHQRLEWQRGAQAILDAAGDKPPEPPAQSKVERALSDLPRTMPAMQSLRDWKARDGADLPAELLRAAVLELTREVLSR